MTEDLNADTRGPFCNLLGAPTLTQTCLHPVVSVCVWPVDMHCHAAFRLAVRVYGIHIYTVHVIVWVLRDSIWARQLATKALMKDKIWIGLIELAQVCLPYRPKYHTLSLKQQHSTIRGLRRYFKSEV